jgi:hypothetical protein
VYDVFFLSFGEPNAQRNLVKLCERIPFAIHVKGIAGIDNAHKRCAEISRSQYFFVIDAESEITNYSCFDFKVAQYEPPFTYLWYAHNPVNGLEYGWGGIKLFNKTMVQTFDKQWLDFSTSVAPLKIIPEVVSITHFNTIPFSAWKAGFRESVKLGFSRDLEAIERQKIWCSVGANELNGQTCINGAQLGREYCLAHINDLEDINKVNDFGWLRTMYDMT